MLHPSPHCVTPLVQPVLHPLALCVTPLLPLVSHPLHLCVKPVVPLRYSPGTCVLHPSHLGVTPTPPVPLCYTTCSSVKPPLYFVMASRSRVWYGKDHSYGAIVQNMVRQPICQTRSSSAQCTAFYNSGDAERPLSFSRMGIAHCRPAFAPRV